ncbi:hypothetical protein Hdeb2414_s0517g00909071 [Helianthus debilis subsp. tardiflorus]
MVLLMEKKMNPSKRFEFCDALFLSLSLLLSRWFGWVRQMEETVRVLAGEHFHFHFHFRFRDNCLLVLQVLDGLFLVLWLLSLV